MQAIFEGDRLDQHGYLLDIAEVEPRLDGIVARYRDRMLNEMPEMAARTRRSSGSRASADRVAQDLPAGNVSALTIKLWESDTAFATCRRALATR